MFHFRTAPASSSPAPGSLYILDLSRSYALAGQSDSSGADPAEAACLAEFLRRDCELWAIVRDGRQFALLDQAAAVGLMRRLNSRGLFGQMASSLAPSVRTALRRRRAQAWLRSRSTFYGARSGLTVLLRARFSQGFDYFDVGPGNPSPAFLTDLRRSASVKIHIRQDNALLPENAIIGAARAQAAQGALTSVSTV